MDALRQSLGKAGKSGAKSRKRNAKASGRKTQKAA
jgi:hypothetical protein